MKCYHVSSKEELVTLLSQFRRKHFKKNKANYEENVNLLNEVADKFSLSEVKIPGSDEIIYLSKERAKQFKQIVDVYCIVNNITDADLYEPCFYLENHKELFYCLSFLLENEIVSKSFRIELEEELKQFYATDTDNELEMELKNCFKHFQSDVEIDIDIESLTQMFEEVKQQKKKILEK